METQIKRPCNQSQLPFYLAVRLLTMLNLFSSSAPAAAVSASSRLSLSEDQFGGDSFKQLAFAHAVSSAAATPTSSTYPAVQGNGQQKMPPHTKVEDALGDGIGPIGRSPRHSHTVYAAIGDGDVRWKSQASTTLDHRTEMTRNGVARIPQGQPPAPAAAPAPEAPAAATAAATTVATAAATATETAEPPVVAPAAAARVALLTTSVGHLTEASSETARTHQQAYVSGLPFAELEGSPWVVGLVVILLGLAAFAVLACCCTSSAPSSSSSAKNQPPPSTEQQKPVTTAKRSSRRSLRNSMKEGGALTNFAASKRASGLTATFQEERTSRASSIAEEFRSDTTETFATRLVEIVEQLAAMLETSAKTYLKVSAPDGQTWHVAALSNTSPQDSQEPTVSSQGLTNWREGYLGWWPSVAAFDKRLKPAGKIPLDRITEVTPDEKNATIVELTLDDDSTRIFEFANMKEATTWASTLETLIDQLQDEDY